MKKKYRIIRTLASKPASELTNEELALLGVLPAKRERTYVLDLSRVQRDK